MQRIVSYLVVILFFFVFLFESDAQVFEKKSNKFQLKSGVKVKTKTPKKLIRIKPNSIKNSSISKMVLKTKKTDQKLEKPLKASKYVNRRLLNNAKKEDE
tara:strand:+ start:144 stop:443 length:300 start_codon:yes stop_codon:yes gene_type:complete